MTTSSIEKPAAARGLVPFALGAVGLLLAVGTACDDGNQTSVGSLVKVSPEPKGMNCPAGGQRIDTGLDKNHDTILGAGEITGSMRAANRFVVPAPREAV